MFDGFISTYWSYYWYFIILDIDITDTYWSESLMSASGSKDRLSLFLFICGETLPPCGREGKLLNHFLKHKLPCIPDTVRLLDKWNYSYDFSYNHLCFCNTFMQLIIYLH